MTALATALALVPLALSAGEPGSEIQPPMAIVILGGLLSSTALDIRVLPALYLATANWGSLDGSCHGTHSMHRTKTALIYRQTKNLRAVQLLPGHTKPGSTVRSPGIEVDDALEISEQTEAWRTVMGRRRTSTDQNTKAVLRQRSAEVARPAHASRGLVRWRQRLYLEGMTDPFPSLASPVSSRTLLALTEAMEHSFDASDWASLGLELDMPQLGDPETRLQEALRCGDDDYGYCIAQFLRHLQGERPSALRDIAHRPKVKGWLDSNTPDAAQELGPGRTQAPAPPESMTASEVLDLALKDADHLLGASGPVSCVDRVHTALHGYLRDVCARANLKASEDASVAQLFESVHNDHPKFAALNQHGPQVGDVLASLAGAVTALDTLRNNAAVAHPNQVLLEEAESMLMVNLVRTLFNFLRARL